MRIEATVQRIGGPDLLPRVWGPNTVHLDEGVHMAWQDLTAPECGPNYLNLRLWAFNPADEHFTACTLQLCDQNGMLIGVRPALFYNEPCDVPLYCTVQNERLDLGVFSVGLRVIQ